MSITETLIHHITEIDIGPVMEKHIDGIDGKRPFWSRKITIVSAEGEVEFSLFADSEDALTLRS